MNIETLLRQFEAFGIWRATILEYDVFNGKFGFEKLGCIKLIVPKTSLHKVPDFKYHCLPAASYLEVEIMKDPLKVKKYTYEFRRI